MSNEEWVNPHDPDAKIGPTKAGATDMIYKPEHTVDLDTGAILQAEVRLGHEADQKDLSQHVLQAQANINQAQDSAADSLTIESTTADKGYHAVAEMKQLQAEGIRTVISDPVKNRKLENLDTEDAQVVRRAKRSAGSKSGKKLLRRRGMHLERSFAHILDAGGARRTTLRGLGNLNKRFKVSAAIYNLSQLMRKLFGVGTPKQLAAMGKALFLVWRTIVVVGCGLFRMDRTNRAERHSSTHGGICFRLVRGVTNGTTAIFGWILRSFEKMRYFNGLLAQERAEQRQRAKERRRRHLPPVELEKQQVILEPPDKLCPQSGEPRTEIGREVTTEYDYLPAKLIIREIGAPQVWPLRQALLPGGEHCPAAATVSAAKQVGAGAGGLPAVEPL